MIGNSDLYMSISSRQPRNGKPYFQHTKETDSIIVYGLSLDYSASQIAIMMNQLVGSEIDKNTILGRLRRLDKGLKKPRK